MKNIYFKILFVAFLGLVGCKSTQKVAIENGNNKIVFDEKTFDPYFKGIGTEPFWNIAIGTDFLIYQDIEGNREIFPVNQVLKAQDANIQLIQTKNSNYEIRATILEQDCSDGMSDINFSNKITVELTGKSTSLSLNGCGDFIVLKNYKEFGN